ncbi:MAG: phosphonate metabolism transcriptional regulator PhnF [Alphaproteobacteria bacterium]
MERTTGIALWRQIAQAIESEISSGVFAPGSRLPTEAQLAERFSVNRHTLRRAMSSLQDRGLIRVEQGRGTFVQDDVIDYLVGRRTRFSDNVRRLGRVPGGRMVRGEHMPADGRVAQGLGLRPGQLVILVELIHAVDNRPLTITAHFFPASRFEGIVDAYREANSITLALRKFGIDDYFRKQTRVSARLPTVNDARHLNMPRTQPIVVAESINVDTDGRPIEFAIARCAGQRMQFVFEPGEKASAAPL